MQFSIDHDASAEAKVISKQSSSASNTAIGYSSTARKVPQLLPLDLEKINRERVSREDSASPRISFPTVKTRRLSDPWPPSPESSPSRGTTTNQATAAKDVVGDSNAKVEKGEFCADLHDTPPSQDAVLNDHLSAIPTTWACVFNTVTNSGKVVEAEQRRIQTHDTNIASLQHQLTSLNIAAAAVEVGDYRACHDAIRADTQKNLSEQRSSVQELASGYVQRDPCSAKAASG
jgi:hypothetical protein